MPGPTRSIAAGFKYNFIGFYGSDGFLTGGTPTAPATGATGSGFRRIVGPKSAAPTVPEPNIVPLTGDDELIGEFQFDSVDQRTFNIEYAVDDLALEGYVQGTNTISAADALLGFLDVLGRAEYDTALIIQSRAKKQDDTNRGAKAWSGVFVPLATAIPLGRSEFSEQSPASYRMSIAPQAASYLPWGVTLTDATHGTTGTRYIKFTSDYPMHIQTFRSNGVATTLTLDYEPVSAAKTAAWFNRTAATVSSVIAANKTVTLSSAGTDGDVITVLYQFAG